jgi:putative flippase GtrA
MGASVTTESAERRASDEARVLRQFWQLVKFAAVGGVGVVVNVAVFNGLWLTVFNPARVAHGPILATVVSTLCAILVNWLGNRYWAFAAERQQNTAREGVEFFAASLIGMLVPLGCIGISHYVLGLHSLLADNIASNVVGLALGTAVRFLLYKFWVYSPRRWAQAGDSPLIQESEDGTVAVEDETEPARKTLPLMRVARDETVGRSAK